MIRRFSISVYSFIRNEMPAHMRGYANMLAMFRGLMAPLKTIADEWAVFRDKSITRAKVTGETISLAWYLNSLFDPIGQGIYIESAGISGLIAGDETAEPGIFIIAGDEIAEPTLFAMVGLPGEGTDFQGRSFCVFVPAAVTATDDEISAVVTQYKFAGKTFLIKRI